MLVGLAGAGISLAPRSAIQDYAHPGLAFVPIHDIQPSVAALAWPRGATNPLVEQFVAVAAQVRDQQAAAGQLPATPARVAPNGPGHRPS